MRHVLHDVPENLGYLSPEVLVGHETVRADRVSGDGNAGAGRLDDDGAHITQHSAQRGVRALPPARRGDADPGDRLAVELAAADRPVEQVLAAALLEHEADLISALTAAERATLTSLLAKLEQTLVPPSSDEP